MRGILCTNHNIISLIPAPADAAAHAILIVKVSATWQTTTIAIRKPGATASSAASASSPNGTIESSWICARGIDIDRSLARPTRPVGLATDHHVFRHRRTAILAYTADNHISGCGIIK